MATPVILPKQGNSVESCLITKWIKQPGDAVAVGDELVEVETDKALFVIESPADGTLLEQFFRTGEEVPVMTNIAAIGRAGESVEDLRPATPSPAKTTPAATPSPGSAPSPQNAPNPVVTAPPNGQVFISPRARHLAARKGVDYRTLAGSGPNGRIIERDIQAAVAGKAPLTRLAQQRAATEGLQASNGGTGVGGRVRSSDLQTTAPAKPPAQPMPADVEVAEVIPVRGIRKVIAERMYASLQSTAQLTMHTSADARALRRLRKQFKSTEQYSRVSINDLLMFAVCQTLLEFPALNAIYDGETITTYRGVNLGFAVDTPRGLLVPVIKKAHTLTVGELSAEAKRLAKAVGDGKIMPDELQGGTFTVTNLGGLNIERFTPIINPPQVAILGVGSIGLKAVEADEAVQFIPHMSLSLTIDHQAVDGAPAARFLQHLTGLLTLLDDHISVDEA